MTADMSKNLQGKYLAWCERCQDGWQGTKRTALKWQFMHNNERHPE